MSEVKLIKGKYKQNPSGLILVETLATAYCHDNLENAINSINLEFIEKTKKLGASYIFVEEYNVIDDFGTAVVVQAFGLVYRLSSGVYR